MARQSQYTLLIICEGQNTEPQFFNTIRDRILKGQYQIGEIEIRIHPEPNTENDDENVEPNQKEYVPERRKRAILPGKSPVEQDISGVPPLKWVLEAQKKLGEGSYDEVWVVFDMDGHPARAEAFSKAKEFINGKQVQIAYSSIAFEYYLLLHFEQIYFAFQKAECRIARVVLNCSTDDNHQHDCLGSKCVGGYARKKGYWVESKGQKSLFPIIENKLEIGFWNAAWIRHESDLRDGHIPFHERNPYITSDNIVKRLTGWGSHHFEFLSLDQTFTISGKLSVVFTSSLVVEVTNIDKISIVLPMNIITVTSLETGIQSLIGDRKVILPAGKVSLPFASSTNELSQSTFSVMIDSFHLGLKL